MKKKLLTLLSTAACGSLMLGLSACQEVVHQHDYQPIVTAPTCTEKGYTTHQCDCGESYTDTYVSALDHKFTNYLSNKDATCEEDGTETATCDNDGCEVTDTRAEKDSAIGHKFTNYLSNEDATCEEDGTETAACDNDGCEKTDTRAEKNSAIGHTFTHYVSNNDATYTKDGTKTANCENDGCKETDTIIDEGTRKVATGRISFKTFTFNKDNVAYGTISNAAEAFSFANEIECNNGAQFIVALDPYGLEVAASQIVPLKVGDNVFYIFESLNGEIIETYAVVIRRRPIYTVAFDTQGGKAIDSQMVEEGSFASAPIPEKLGYTFTGWDYDFSKPITSYTTVTAGWEANKDTPYTVKYYLQNAENDDYTLKDTLKTTGTTDSLVYAPINSYDHYIPTKTEVSGTVSPDGSLVLEVYYNLETFTVTFQGNGGIISSGAKQTIKYGNDAENPVVSRAGYEFIQWDKAFTNVTQDLTVTASWEIIIYNVSYNVNGGEIANNANPTTYTIEMKTPLVNPTREYYKFLGWHDGTRFITNFYGITGTLHLTAQWEYIFQASDNVLTGLTEYGKNNYATIVLPSVINGITITEIGYGALANCTAIRRLTIPETITCINNSAFKGCTALETLYYNAINCQDASYENSYNCIFDEAGKMGAGLDVIVGKQVQYIPAGLFYPYNSEVEKHTPNLKTLTFEEGSVCESIGQGAFEFCSTLKEITLPNSLKTIAPRAFHDCKSLQKVILPDSLETLGFAAFMSCDALTEIKLSENMTIIPSNAFGYCESLQSLTIPKNITSIEVNAFVECTALETLYFNAANLTTTKDDNLFYQAGKNGNGIAVTIGKDVVKIPDYLFCPSYGTSGVSPKITSVQFESQTTCTAIGAYAFYYCKYLTDIQLPDSITSIGAGAFFQCKTLTNVTLPNGLAVLGTNAFSNTSLSYNVYDNGYYLGSTENPYLVLVDPVSTDITSIQIHEDTKIIYSSMFTNCSKLTSVTIPESVTLILPHTFYQSNFTKITFENPNGWYFTKDPMAANGSEGTISMDVTDPKLFEKLSDTYYTYYCKRS